MRYLIFAILSIFSLSPTPAQSAHKLKKEAQEAFKEGNYKIAEEKYRLANEQKSDAATDYNLGNSLFNQERYEEAYNYFLEASGGL
ncbi:MAG TPA: hypothetical protein PK246_11655, partial [Saprospiraceae bacterium]|nr:hypothetical protein [Saprospiraceae bacterium]